MAGVRPAGHESRRHLDDESHDQATNQRGHECEPVEYGFERLPADDELARHKGADPNANGIDEPFIASSGPVRSTV